MACIVLLIVLASHILIFYLLTTLNVTTNKKTSVAIPKQQTIKIKLLTSTASDVQESAHTKPVTNDERSSIVTSTIPIKTQLVTDSSIVSPVVMSIDAHSLYVSNREDSELIQRNKENSQHTTTQQLFNNHQKYKTASPFVHKLTDSTINIPSNAQIQSSKNHVIANNSDVSDEFQSFHDSDKFDNSNSIDYAESANHIAKPFTVETVPATDINTMAKTTIIDDNSTNSVNNTPVFAMELAKNKQIQSIDAKNFEPHRQHKPVVIGKVINDRQARQHLTSSLSTGLSDTTRRQLSPELLNELQNMLTTKDKNRTVKISFFIDKAGRVVEKPHPIIERSSGNLHIDNDALNKIVHAKFQPFIENNKNIQVLAEIIIRY